MKRCALLLPLCLLTLFVAISPRLTAFNGLQSMFQSFFPQTEFYRLNAFTDFQHFYSLDNFGFIVMCSGKLPQRFVAMLATWLSKLPHSLRQNVVFVSDNRKELINATRNLISQCNHPLVKQLGNDTNLYWWEDNIVEFNDHSGKRLTGRVPYAFQVAFLRFSKNVKWYLKVDDDTLVQIDRLISLPYWSKYNADTQYVQLGRVKVKEIKRNLIENGTNGYVLVHYCEGGAGYVLSRALLKVMDSEQHWDYCKYNICTENSPEDVCMTLCIRSLANRWKSPKLREQLRCRHVRGFYQKLRKTETIRKVATIAATLHPLKTLEEVEEAFKIMY